jgi:hypothetical protein
LAYVRLTTEPEGKRATLLRSDGPTPDLTLLFPRKSLLKEMSVRDCEAQSRSVAGLAALGAPLRTAVSPPASLRQSPWHLRGRSHSWQCARGPRRRRRSASSPSRGTSTFASFGRADSPGFICVVVSRRTFASSLLTSSSWSNCRQLVHWQTSLRCHQLSRVVPSRVLPTRSVRC